MIATDNLYTFVLDFAGGTYVSQVRASNAHDASIEWVRAVGLNHLNISDEDIKSVLAEIMELDEEPVKLAELTNVWCISFLLKDKLALVNIIKTSDTLQGD